MNDRYLYRAKRIDNGEWVEGFLVELGKESFSDEIRFGIAEKAIPILGKTVFNLKIDEINPSTICQCTGLKDKNGKLIWENDIVSFQFDNDDCPFPNKDTKKRIGKVFFSDFRASWSIAMGKNGSKSLNNDLWKYVQNGNRVEIVGNIFDNPELLE